MHRIKELPPKKMDPENQKLETAKTEQGSSLRKWTTEDVELALRVLALNGGNASKTSNILEAEHNSHIPGETLRRWANVQFTSRYAQIVHELRNTISQNLASTLTANTQKAADITSNLLDSIADEYESLEPIEKSRVAKDMASVASQNLDKSMLLRGQPTDISVSMSPEDIIAELNRMSVKVKNEEETTREPDLSGDG